MVVGGRPPDKKIEDRPPDGWLPLDTFVDARLRTFIADSFFNINGKRLKFTKRDWDTAVQSLSHSLAVMMRSRRGWILCPHGTERTDLTHCFRMLSLPKIRS